jgi:RNA polymerase sigma-70 factor (ECF subfamily)
MSARVIPLVRHAPDTRSDEDVVAACAAGDNAALGELFDRYAPAVWRFVTRFFGTPVDSDDLVQATFLELWRCSSRFRGASSVRVWILGVAYNLCRRHVRTRSRRRAFLDGLALLPSAPERPLDELTHDRRLLARAIDLLHELSPEHRVALMMVDLEGIASVEAARALGIPTGTFGRRLFEARRRLRQALAEEEAR